MPQTKQSGASRRASQNNPSRKPASRPAIAMANFTLEVPNRVKADDDLERAVKGASERTRKKLGSVHNKSYRPGQSYPKGPAYTDGVIDRTKD